MVLRTTPAMMTQEEDRAEDDQQPFAPVDDQPADVQRDRGGDEADPEERKENRPALSARDHLLTEGRRPSDSPTCALARRFPPSLFRASAGQAAGSLRSRGSLRCARSQRKVPLPATFTRISHFRTRATISPVVSRGLPEPWRTTSPRAAASPSARRRRGGFPGCRGAPETWRRCPDRSRSRRGSRAESAPPPPPSRPRAPRRHPPRARRRGAAQRRRRCRRRADSRRCGCRSRNGGPSPPRPRRTA